MRVLLVSDLHYSLPQLDWVVDVSSSYDVVAVAGDSLNISSAVPLEAQSIVVSRYLEEIASRTQLVVSSGNHDLTGPDEHGEQTALWLSEARRVGIPIDGESVVVEDTLLTICPWWDGPKGRSEVALQLQADAARRPVRWVWLYHWPPLGSPTCWTGRRDYGDSDVRGGSRRSNPTWSSVGTCTNRPSRSTDRGSTGSARPGCSTRVTRSGRCPPSSNSTWQEIMHDGRPSWARKHWTCAIPCRRPVPSSDLQTRRWSTSVRRAAGGACPSS